jgi:hypothetical protein
MPHQGRTETPHRRKGNRNSYEDVIPHRRLAGCVSEDPRRGDSPQAAYEAHARRSWAHQGNYGAQAGCEEQRADHHAIAGIRSNRAIAEHPGRGK